MQLHAIEMGCSAVVDQPLSMPDKTCDEPKPASRKRVRCNTACTVCRNRKIRCDGSSPCGRCVRLGLDCSYEADRRSATTSIARVSPPSALVPRPMSFGAPVFGAADVGSVKKFFSFFHPVIPLASTRTIQAGMNQLSLDVFGEVANDVERSQDIACRSVAWSVAALGSLLESPALAERNLEFALGYLHQVIAIPSAETLSALMGIAECLVFMNKMDLAARYTSVIRSHYEHVKESLK